MTNFLSSADLKNGYWLNKPKLREILKGAYKKGVISLDTMLDKMEMFD